MRNPNRFVRGSSPPGAPKRSWGLRLFPAVACAAGALLVLKSIDVMQNPGSRSTLAEMAERRAASKFDPETTGSTAPAKKKEEKADAKADPKIDPSTAPGAKAVPLEGQPPLSAAEKSLLQRLGDRREQLDDRQRELDTREQLLKAADKKLEAKINELKSLEHRPAGQPDAGSGAAPAGAPAAGGSAGPAEQGGLKNIVTMYEAMKPKDAAKVFDRLDLKVLVPVVNAMNPRKMSEVLAAMSPEAAERLTVELAKPSLRFGPPQAGLREALPAGELQAIEPRKP
jgi:flagellar motility protein MotE (MotC chaperone)